MKKLEILNKIRTIATESSMDEDLINAYKNLIKKGNSTKRALKNVLTAIEGMVTFKDGKYSLLTMDQVMENIRITELESAIIRNDIKAINNYTESIKKSNNEYISECQEIEFFNSIFQPDLINVKSNFIVDPREKSTIKNIASIKKSEFLLFSKAYRTRKNILSKSFKYPNILDVNFFKIMDTLSYCYEYQMGGVEFYRGEPNKTPGSKLTVILTEMLGSNILNDRKMIVKLCTHFYNKYVDFMKPLDILWIIERPISETKSNYYQVSFDYSFKFDVRYTEEIYRLNKIYDLSLPLDTTEITIYSSDCNKVRKIKSLKHLIVLHQLNNILSDSLKII